MNETLEPAAEPSAEALAASAPEAAQADMLGRLLEFLDAGGPVVLILLACSVVALAIGWGALMPVLTRLAARFDGRRSGERPAYISDGWQKADSHG